MVRCYSGATPPSLQKRGCCGPQHHHPSVSSLPPAHKVGSQYAAAPIVYADVCGCLLQIDCGISFLALAIYVGRYFMECILTYAMLVTSLHSAGHVGRYLRQHAAHVGCRHDERHQRVEASRVLGKHPVPLLRGQRRDRQIRQQLPIERPQA